jgi:acetate kinase
MQVLVVNPGSSSLKLSVLDADGEIVDEHDVASVDGQVEVEEIERFLARWPAVVSAGVRFVHGGPSLRQSAMVDAGVLDRLERVADLAPLHNPPALVALGALRRLRPGLPLVACFDTAFFAGLPPAAATYALPHRWTTEWGIRRFGFHGLSHAYASRRAARLLDRPPKQLRLVTCHLGAGASLAAVVGGLPVDTTMGFTPLDGLVMATRSGSVDPGALIWVLRHGGLSIDDVEFALDRGSGLLGLSGTSGDIRQVFTTADRGDERAQLAIAVYIHRLRASVAAMAAATGGLDAVVFTGGVGENSPRVREQTCAGLGFLGVSLDPGRNAETVPTDRDIATTESSARVLVVRSREDREIAREVRRLIPSPALSTSAYLTATSTPWVDWTDT